MPDNASIGNVRYDRLSALIQRFSLQVSICAPGHGNMRVLTKHGSDTAKLCKRPAAPKPA